MPGNPKKEGRTGPAYQVGRRRHTRVPGYHSVLPRVFPYLYQGASEIVTQLATILREEELTGFAVTSHPSTVDGHEDLWLSAENAEFLIGIGAVGRDRIKST